MCASEDVALANALLRSEISVLRSRVDVLEAKLERAERIVDHVRKLGMMLLNVFGINNSKSCKSIMGLAQIGS
jgi:hypothetical protein